MTAPTVHARTHHYLPSRTAVDRFNSRLAILITRAVGSMWCAYLFSLLALCSLPAILTQTGWVGHPFPSWLVDASLITLVAWVAQTLLQLVLLPIILVGQQVQSSAADARAAKIFEDSEFVKNQVDEHTDGGIKTILEAIQALNAKIPSGG